MVPKTLPQPLNYSKNKKGFVRRRGDAMNHPEFRPVIIFDDTSFEVGDPIKVVTTKGREQKGLLTEILKEYFSVRKGSEEPIFFYDQIAHMELTDLSECDS